MNQNFSFKRYVWLLKRQWYENAVIYKLVIGGIFIVTMAVGWLIWFSGDLSPNEYPRFRVDQNAFINIDVPILLFCIFGACFFNSLSSENRRVVYFSLPVSPFERVAVAFTFVMALPVLMATVFNVSNFAYLQVFNHIHGSSIIPNNFFGIQKSWLKVILNISFISMFTLGSLIYGKKGIVVTTSVVVLVVFSTFIPVETTNTEKELIKVKVETSETVETIKEIKSIRTSVTGKEVGGSSSGSSSFTGVSFNTLKESIETVDVSEMVNTSRKVFLIIIFKILYCSIAPLCWIMMYFTMKRKEA